MQRRAILTLAVACALAATASACDRGKPVSVPPGAAEAPPPAEATSLWRIEVLDGGKAASAVDICADRNVQAAFVRPAPELQGKPCVRVADPVETDTTYSVRCRVDDALYRVGSSTTGDTAREFTVEMAVTRQDMKGPMFEQVRRYRRLGDCPAGWKIGDSAAPGATQVVNTLTGETRAGSGAAQ